MVRTLVLGYCCAVRSARRWCEEVHLSLAFRWLCHQGLEDEVDLTWTMVERAEAQFDLTPQRVISDTANGTASMLACMVEEKDIEPHGPVGPDRARRR